MKQLIIMAALLAAGLATACAPQGTAAPTPTDLLPPAQTEAAGAYMIVQGRNYAPAALGPYAASLPPIYAKYGGRYVAFSTDYDVMEGTSDYQATIISAWPNAEAARAFWTSPEYIEAKKLRDGIGDFDVIIVPALPARSGPTQ